MREVRGGQTVMEKTVSWGKSQTKDGGRLARARRSGGGWREGGRDGGGGEGGMHGEVDGWMAHGKHRESRAE